jgi:glutamyl-tRNA synthetase
MNIVTRFAPSPTGYLHVGGARTALFNWLFARHTGGQFLLRIEDTDQARSTQQACDQLLEDLKWLGLQWDNPELMFQSKRLPTYNAIIDRLIAQGKAYKAYETPEELAAMRAQAEKEKRPFLYRRPTLNTDQLAQYERENRPHVVRLVMPPVERSFHDVLVGKDVVMSANEAQDFVIRKADGMPTYHFAVVVDDHEMGVTHILRGQEHLKNTFNHLALMEALDYQDKLIYAHLSTIQNMDGTKMGKRDRDKKVREATHNFIKNSKKTAAEIAAAAGLDPQRVSDWLANSKSQLDPMEHEVLMPVINLKPGDLPEILVHDFRRNGYLPEALLNFLALLGWSPGGDRERMTIAEMIQLFTIERIGNANAKFDRTKLLAFNTEACAAATEDRLVRAFRDYLSVNPDSPVNQATDDQLRALLAMKKGFRILREVDELCRFFFIADDAVQYDPKAVEKVLKKDNALGLAALRDVRDILGRVTDWRHAEMERMINIYCDGMSLDLGKVAQPIRVAISGTTVSPPIFQSLEFLGKAKTLARIDRCLAAHW